MCVVELVRSQTVFVVVDPEESLDRFTSLPDAQAEVMGYTKQERLVTAR